MEEKRHHFSTARAEQSWCHSCLKGKKRHHNPRAQSQNTFPIPRKHHRREIPPASESKEERRWLHFSPRCARQTSIGGSPLADPGASTGHSSKPHRRRKRANRATPLQLLPCSSFPQRSPCLNCSSPGSSSPAPPSPLHGMQFGAPPLKIIHLKSVLSLTSSSVHEVVRRPVLQHSSLLRSVL